MDCRLSAIYPLGEAIKVPRLFKDCITVLYYNEKMAAFKANRNAACILSRHEK